MRTTSLLLTATLLPLGLAAADPRVTDAVLGEGKPADATHVLVTIE
jgi:hypothetical protein